MMGGWMGWHEGMGWGGGFLMVVFWVLAIVGVVLLVRLALGAGGRGGGAGGSRETPLEILKKRYARGEISREEYERMKRELE